MEAIRQAVGGKPLEIWFADEARIGQKNKITRRWAKRGTRPSAPKDQRTASAYIFGAICPAHGKGAGLVLPRCTTEGMTLHLNEIAQAVAPGAHALVLVDPGKTSICIVDDAGKIVREVKVASEPGALLSVLKNSAYRFKRIGKPDRCRNGCSALSPKQDCL